MNRFLAKKFLTTLYIAKGGKSMNLFINSIQTKINANRLTFKGNSKEQTAPTTKPQKPDTFEKQPVEAGKNLLSIKTIRQHEIQWCKT